MKCVAWFPQQLDPSISFSLGFFTPNICVSYFFGAPLHSMPFVESFVEEAFQKDLNIIASLLMLANP
jgi:hypothetical protein